MAKKSFKDLAKQLEPLREAWQEAKEQYESDVDEWWDGLDNDDQLKAFYKICKLIHKADVEDKGSYRYALYDVFNFGPDAYSLGMDCGYMNIHNLLFTAVEFEENCEKLSVEEEDNDK